MKAVGALIGRNLRLFFRDRMTVFFSLMAAMLLFVLYTLFLGQLQTSDLQESFPSAPHREIRAFVDSWMFAGVVSMASITTGLGALGVFVEDASTGRFRDLLVSPIRPGQLVLGYFGAALIIAVTITLGVLTVSLTYLRLADGVALPVGAVARAVGVMVVTAAAFAAVSAFVTSFVTTPGAYSALCTIVGTTLGFLAGAYVPVGSFPASAQAVIGGLPFAQASMLMRREFAGEGLDAIAAADPGARDQLRAYFGLDLSVGDLPVAAPFVMASLIGTTVLFAWLGAIRIRRRVTRIGAARRSAAVART
ncbi:ABC transporter permease [Microbacterium sp.]|uniref:ABC transporter permease n=1 Tax=Microbacterium sp. TaxID=51671 RepID=UPI00281134C5|nr:ABC transporter permease [Microbacterium sp.]